MPGEGGARAADGRGRDVLAVMYGSCLARVVAPAFGSTETAASEIAESTTAVVPIASRTVLFIFMWVVTSVQSWSWVSALSAGAHGPARDAVGAASSV